MPQRVRNPLRRNVAPTVRLVLDDLAAFLFPDACRHCGAVDMDAGHGAPVPLRTCRLQNGRLRRHVLGPINLPLRLLCAACCRTLVPTPAPSRSTTQLDIAAFQPSPVLFTLVHALKYDGIVELIPWLGAYMARAARRHLSRGPVALVPIPLHAHRMAERGFNQSALLAHDVGKRLGIPVWETFLERRRATPPLARLAHAARAAQVRGAFGRAAKRDPSFRLVLVDDIVTTGATRRAARSALSDSGSTGCGYLALCCAREAAPWRYDVERDVW